MKFLVSLLYFLAVAKGLQASPTPLDRGANEVSSRSLWNNILWEKYLPTIGAVGILGALASLVFFGTHVDQKYQSLQTEAAKHAGAAGEGGMGNLNLGGDDAFENMGEMNEDEGLSRGAADLEDG
jgi:hypothetical protein